MRAEMDERSERIRLSGTLLQCLRAGIHRAVPAPTGPGAERLSLADGEKMIAIAKGHGVLPLLLRGVDRIGDGSFPPRWIEQLRSVCRVRTLECLRLTGALLEILDLLGAGGIVAIPFKGPSLAALAYANPAMRQYGDLDILLRREDFGRAVMLMQAAGYSVEQDRYIVSEGSARAEVPAPQPRSKFRLDYDCRLRCPARGIPVELHWRMIPWYFGPPLGVGAGGRPPRSVDLGGRSVQTLPVEDLLIYVCMHGMKHCWDKFLLVYDVAALVDSCGDEIDWVHLGERAAGLGVGRMVGVGLRLAEDLLGVAHPSSEHTALANNPDVARIASDLRPRLLSSLGWESPRDSLPLVGHTASGIVFHLRAKERLRDRFRYCLGMGIGVALEASRREFIGERVRFLFDRVGWRGASQTRRRPSPPARG